MTSRRLRTYARHGCSSSRRRPANAAPGFTLVEVVVAMAILLVVMIGVLSAISFAYTSSTDTEMRNIATNVASYTLEYLRARTITRGTSVPVLTALGITSSSTETYGWYDGTTNPTGAFPSMIDVANLPLQSNGWPCNYTSTAVSSTTSPKKDGDTNPSGTSGIGAGSPQVIRFASKHAVLPTDTYGPLLSTTSLAWSTTLQGYVSVMNPTPSDTQEPLGADEDKNVARMVFSSTNMYRTLLTNAWTGLIVRYPGVYPSTPPLITSFTPLTNYVAKVYTTDTDTVGPNSRVSPNSQEYDPYYTNSQKALTQAYRGFRVLTQIVARSTVAALDANNFRHVQYYDVTVTVLWMNGTHESNYELVSQIAAY